MFDVTDAILIQLHKHGCYYSTLLPLSQNVIRRRLRLGLAKESSILPSLREFGVLGVVSIHATLERWPV